MVNFCLWVVASILNAISEQRFVLSRCGGVEGGSDKSMFLCSSYPYVVQAMLCYIAVYKTQTKQQQTTHPAVCMISRLVATVWKEENNLLSLPKASV